MWLRTCRAWSLNFAARVSSSGASMASRYASNGAFESTTMFLRPGKLHDQVGPQPAVFVVGRLLLDEIAMFQHAGHFHHAAQLDFAPAAAGLRTPQGLHQIGRLAAQVLLRFRKRADLLGQAAIGLDAALFDLLQLGVHLAQRFLDRLDQFVDGRLPLFQIALGRLPETSPTGSWPVPGTTCCCFSGRRRPGP